MPETAKQIVDTWIAPLIRADGGDIAVVHEDSDCVTVRLTGACVGCPGAPFTKARIVEPALRSALGKSLRVAYEHVPFAAGRTPTTT